MKPIFALLPLLGLLLLPAELSAQDVQLGTPSSGPSAASVETPMPQIEWEVGTTEGFGRFDQHDPAGAAYLRCILLGPMREALSKAKHGSAIALPLDPNKIGFIAAPDRPREGDRLLTVTPGLHTMFNVSMRHARPQLIKIPIPFVVCYSGVVAPSKSDDPPLFGLTRQRVKDGPLFASDRPYLAKSSCEIHVRPRQP